ncbi:peptidase associated/transthyretin-like domain-containing protein [Blastopirellula retiformator]|uniref:Nickel uptake substrate-specific transmembrane region n=1 Tax=Blastopirellula retiformator TaxID=2527970 RepID=A0A5C5V2X6_9BACT|nr:carboxypeptidase-like regulatory domain-containing protein [Blastopirellula retiformator]TWT32964.1 hypothetical protein Enr8_27800 [Blastopirellula retiformator]
MKLSTILFAFLASFAFAGFATADEWGTIKGKFVINGPIKPPAPMPGFAGMARIPNQIILVGPKGELQNVAVWLTVERGETYPDPHPSYAETASDTIEISSNRFAITPRVTFIHTSQTIRFRNVAPVVENFVVDGFVNAPVNLLLDAGKKQDLRFVHEERIPIVIWSGIRHWMQGYLLLLDSPYAAITDANGEFEIKNLPEGTWTFTFWHESVGYLKEITLDGKPQSERKGGYEIEVVVGGSDRPGADRDTRQAAERVAVLSGHRL